MSLTILSANDMLAKLSPELRNHVYKYVFEDDERVEIPGAKRSNRLSLLRTARLYHQEASSFFYSSAHIIFQDLPLLHAIPENLVGYLKRVTLDFHAARSSSSNAVAISAMIKTLSAAKRASGAKYTEITFVIKCARNMPALLNGDLDDSVLEIDHCITESLCHLVQANVSYVIKIRLKLAWFGPKAAQSVQQWHTIINPEENKLLFFTTGDLSPEYALADVKDCERDLSGHYADDGPPVLTLNSDLEPTGQEELMSDLDTDTDEEPFEESGDDNSEDEKDEADEALSEYLACYLGTDLSQY